MSRVYLYYSHLFPFDSWYVPRISMQTIRAEGLNLLSAILGNRNCNYFQHNIGGVLGMDVMAK